MSRNGTEEMTTLNVSACTQVAIRILRKWGMDEAGIEGMLGLNPRAEGDDDTLQRVSCILNIHAALGSVFNNPDNVYGFMKMENHNLYFDGRRPIDIIASGRIADLIQVERHITSLNLW